MEEELSEHELEERMYSTLHYVDDTQANVIGDSNAKDGVEFDYLPRSNVRRYWRTSGDQNSLYRKTNPPQNTIVNNVEKQQQKQKPHDEKQNSNPSKSKPSESNPSKSVSVEPSQTNPDATQTTKEEKPNTQTPTQTSNLSIFNQPVSKNLKKTIEILDNDDDIRVVELETSDEDEVIEVVLPPKPTITIESSDEDDISCPTTVDMPTKDSCTKTTDTRVLREREVSSSPVPSIVSSVSDEFIRGDCIALNISSRHNNNQSFDFSLHGTDLLGQTPSKKKKKKNKNSATSTPISKEMTTEIQLVDSCFATPKSKAKNKKKSKANKTQKSIINADIYDSDSNFSMNESNKNTYTVTERSLPSADVYESDSNQSELNRAPKPKNQEISSTEIDSSDSSITGKPEETVTGPSTTDNITVINESDLIDLTDAEPEINESIVMANVTGFTEEIQNQNEPITNDTSSKLGSTKIPAILCEDLDFDNLKGKDQVFKRRRYSLTTLRAEMEKFYNESWGGENFNHREIQKNMSRDKSLWVIDPKDKMPSATKRKVTCNYCNRIGHRDDTCKWKPPVCFMCGSVGHYEPRCPKKICVNCGSPNHIYSNMCRNCAHWPSVTCKLCGQSGHPATHCPDVWRRYHDTIEHTAKLEENRQTKKHYQHFCSGCTRRGHLVHSCRNSLPFSGLPINSPYVFSYDPIYPVYNENINPNKYTNQPDSPTFPNVRTNQNKRQSKSPVIHETHVNKKRHLSVSESGDAGNNKNPFNVKHVQDKSIEVNKDKDIVTVVTGRPITVEPAPDFIPINRSPNHNEKGQMIQDNEVSDTSEVITSAKIYLTKEIKEALTTDEGKTWLNSAMEKNKITVEENNPDYPFLTIKGSVGNQEAFQSELREWTRTKQLHQSGGDSNRNQTHHTQSSDDMPKKRIILLNKLTKALESLQRDIGDPNALFKELRFLQNRHGQLTKTKVVSSAQLENNRENMKRMMKKLNMILLGQAGLAGGTEHLTILYDLQRKLTNLRQNNVSKQMREEIGSHFRYIFSAFPRDDYADLVNKYYVSSNHSIYKKRNDRVFKISPKPQKKSVNFIQRNNETWDVEVVDKTAPRAPSLEATLNKLVFYHRRLINTRPTDSGSKKKRLELVNKLHGSIGMLGKFTHISPKTLKKMRKIQEQAQLFLSNV